MPRDKELGQLLISADSLRKLTDLMDELAFRGPMQEALIMRVANCGGFNEVITRIKRRRLYSKKMRDGASDSDESSAPSSPKRRLTKKARKRATARLAATHGGQQEQGTGGE